MYNTQIVPFDNPDSVGIALEYLQEAKIISVPTDTVYGIMANYQQPLAIKKIYTIKERPLSKALPVLIGGIEQLELVAFLPADDGRYGLMRKLTDKWWPGALTLILPARPDLPKELTGDKPTTAQRTIAVRLPNHERLRELLRLSGPAAATSANLSGCAETTDASAVMAQLADRLPVIFDGGICRGGMGSTIVDLTNPLDERPAILRAGPLVDEIKALPEFQGE